MQFKPRLMIRDLLWLVVIVALAVGWWLHSRSLIDTRDRNREEFDRRVAKLAMDGADFATIYKQKQSLEERHEAESETIKSLRAQLSASPSASAAAPKVEIEIAGPQTAKLAEDVSFDVTVANRGTTAATGLSVIDSFDRGLKHGTDV